jgi:iron complex outermembrane receptor protein
MNIRHCLWVAVMAFALIAGIRARAADTEPASDSNALSEVVVTASRTGETKIQNTPIAVSAFSGAQLTQSSLYNVQDLNGYVPNLNISQSTTYAEIFIRGIGSTNVYGGSDPSTAVQVDGVYLGRPYAQFADFLDVERIEILRGPQGTLYGRNAAAGVINVASRAPSDTFEAMMQLDQGNYWFAQEQGYVSGPLIPGKVQGSIAVSYVRHDPYIENVAPGGNDIFNANHGGVRAQLRVEPTEQIDATTRMDFHLQDEAQESYSKLIGPFSPAINSVRNDFFKVALNMPNSDRVQTWGVSEDITVDLSNALKLKSISAYRNNINRVNLDSDDTDASITHVFQGEGQNQLSQELSLIGNFRRVSFVSGLYYLHERVDTDVTVDVYPAGVYKAFLPINRTDASAAYSQGTYNITDTLGFTLGARYTAETKSQEQNGGLYTIPTSTLLGPATIFQNKNRFHATTPKVSVQWKPSTDVMLYASATKGYKSGGFNFSAATAATAEFAPETLWSYELGAKSEWLDHRLRINLTTFLYHYSNLQEFLATAPGVAIIANAAAARVKGVELEITAKPIQGLDLTANLSQLNAVYTRYLNAPVPQSLGPYAVDATGNRLDNAPPYSAYLAAQYSWSISLGGSLFARTDYTWQDRVFYEPTNYILQSQASYGLLNASFGYLAADAKWHLDLWAKNLTNKEYFTGTQDAGAYFSGQPGAPRTYGIRYIRKW